MQTLDRQARRQGEQHLICLPNRQFSIVANRGNGYFSANDLQLLHYLAKVHALGSEIFLQTLHQRCHTAR